MTTKNAARKFFKARMELARAAIVTLRPAARCMCCEALMINGVYCHETGCPNAWKHPRLCKWCGIKYDPEARHQYFCCEDCMRSFHGYDLPDD